MDNCFQNHPSPSGWKDFQIRNAELLFQPEIYPSLHFVSVWKLAQPCNALIVHSQEYHNMGWTRSSVTSNSWVPTPPPLYSRRFPLPPLSPCQPPRLPLQSWSLQCHSCYTLLLLMARYAKLLFFGKIYSEAKNNKNWVCKVPKKFLICKNAISWKYSLPDLRLPSFAKCTNGSGCAVGEHSRRNVDSVDRLQWFRGERAVSVTPQRLRNEKYEFIWIFCLPSFSLS